MEPLPPLTDEDPKPQALVIDDFPFVMLIRWIGDRPPHGHPREEMRMFTDLRRVVVEDSVSLGHKDPSDA